MEKPAELVFIPSPGIGHLVSTVEIAKLLVSRDDQLLITVLIMKFPSDSLGTDAYIESFTHSSNSKRIKFINLPQVNTDDIKGNSGSFMIDFIASQQPHVKDAVTKLAESETRLAGFVIDMFCTSMIDVANEFGVPTYVFFTSGAAALGLMFHLQALRDHDGKYKDCTEFKDSDAELLTPSFVNPLPAAKVIPGRLLGKETANSFLNIIKRFRGTKGILVNTFTELEPHPLHALLSDAEIPPVYPVGPLLNLNNDKNSVGLDEAKQKSDILKWLDDQPPLSVVFLCFGSMGSFGEDQVKEIAQALENVGHRFLWSLRRPPPEGKIGFPSDYDDHRGVFPEGFLDRTVGTGKVIGWAPQNAILAHPSVGGFVSHCGWNSTLESLWHGVPVATWPLYAEQQLNAFELVKELGLAVEIDMSYRNSSPVLVSAQKIERGIREVMELNSDIRKRVREMSVKSKKALMDGGSSYSSLGRFINQIFN
ncbi:hypothetical protein M0R45_032609 [Rubus argutus]|uniref:Glycosyltransferase n=1 Tax=Rubus argutus TaxID=59490 RepID=A0AAW1WJ72_RUBAR